jgi:hypothetical protein
MGYMASQRGGGGVEKLARCPWDSPLPKFRPPGGRKSKDIRPPFRPRLHGNGRIWNRAEIRPFRPCKHTRTMEPDEFETP